MRKKTNKQKLEVHDNEFLVRVRYKRLGELKGGQLSYPERREGYRNHSRDRDSALVFRVNGQMFLTFRNKKHRKKKKFETVET